MKFGSPKILFAVSQSGLSPRSTHTACTSAYSGSMCSKIACPCFRHASKDLVKSHSQNKKQPNCFSGQGLQMHLHDHQHKRRRLDHGLDLNDIPCMKFHTSARARAEHNSACTCMYWPAAVDR